MRFKSRSSSNAAKKIKTKDFGVVTYVELATVLNVGINNLRDRISKFGLENAIDYYKENGQRYKKKAVYKGFVVFYQDMERLTGLPRCKLEKIIAENENLDITNIINGEIDKCKSRTSAAGIKAEQKRLSRMGDGSTGSHLLKCTKAANSPK